MGRVKRIWYLSPMRAAMVQASLGIRAVSPEPLLLAHTSSESRGTFKQKARSLAPLNGWACADKICHDGMLKDTNSLDASKLSLGVPCLYYAACITTSSGIIEPSMVALLDALPSSTSAWYADNRKIDRYIRQHSFMEFGHEIISTTILSLLLIQEGQLSVTGERMCIKHW